MSLYLQLSKSCLFFPLSSMWVDEPGDPCFGHIYWLRSGECPPVPDGCNAHPPSLHPEKWRWCTPHCLPVQPQPRWGKLHLGCPSTCSNQWRLAYSCLRTALAEVHHLLWERLRWVGLSCFKFIVKCILYTQYLYSMWSQLFHLHINVQNQSPGKSRFCCRPRPRTNLLKRINWGGTRWKRTPTHKHKHTYGACKVL